MGKRLYVIGNGFDLHHGIPSSYAAFGIYLKLHDRKTYDVVERYFDVNASFWFEFEERLASFDTDSLIQDASDCLVSYAAEDWSDSYNHDYQSEISEAVEAVSTNMRARFADWVRQLPIPGRTALAGTVLPIDPQATFLNFNYTPSLQRIYGVPEPNVLHIHGSAANATEQLVLGHGWKPDEQPASKRGDDEEPEDVRVAEGTQIVNDYFKKTFKPTDRIITDHGSFFSSLACIDEIMVMGHSLAEVDQPYFSEILRNVDTGRARWTVSYHQNSNEARDRFAVFNVDPALVQFLKLNEF